MSTRHGFHSWHTFLVVVLLISLLMMGIPALAVAAPPQGSISGHVYTSDGSTPVAGATICAVYYPAGGLAEVATSGADGSYTILTLAAGQYAVHAVAASYQTEYYNNVRNEGDATPVAVADPGNTSGIDFTMAPAGSISGHIYEADGTTPIAGAEVFADYFDANTYANSDYSAADGSYSIGGLVTENYSVRALASNHRTIYYNQHALEASADPVEVDATGDTSGIDFELPLVGTISGTVYEQDGITPIAGARVIAYYWSSGSFANEDYTSADGRYTITGLGATYFAVRASAHGFDTEWYNNKTAWEYLDASTDKIQVVPPADVPGIDFTLNGAADPVIVIFPDANLEAAIREAIGKPTGDIYQSDLDAMTSLVADGRGISNLSGLEHCTSLTQLDLSWNQVADLTPIAGLTGLTSLELDYNEIGDASPLVGLTGLEWLSLDDNDVSDISPLAGLADLEYLFLYGNRISDLSPLSGLTGLAYMWAPDNQISNISPLSGLSSLTSVVLGYNQISDISPLSSLAGLTYLSLGSNQIADISPLSSLAHLRSLDLCCNQISNISSLSSLVSLEYLSLYNNQIGDISPLSSLARLENLFLYSNQIGDVSPLSSLTNLTYLWVDVNRIGDISPLCGLTSLASLSLGSNQISDVSPLASLTGLTSLELTYNQIGDIYPLSALTRLTHLGLGGNDIADISPIASLTSLTFLNLWTNQITDISPLIGLTGITFLSLQNNQISDISPLSSLVGLEYLTLHSNLISDISPLSSLTGLMELDLDGNLIVDISPLSGLTNLTDLSLYDNGIGDISPLSALTGLTSLWVGSNQISDISPLAGLASLVSLGLDGNQIGDLTPISGLTGLTSLWLGDNQISDISPLSSLTGLTELGLDSNLIVDTSPLSGLTNLTCLVLSYNQTSDISALSGLTSLTGLYLYGNRISDISPLSGLGSLTYLVLSYNQISDIGPLVDNVGLAAGDWAYLWGNPLNSTSWQILIPQLEARGVSVYWDTVNQIPVQPTNVSPVSGAVGISLTPVLQSSAFSDPDADDIHSASQWQIRTSSGSYSSPVFDTGTDASHLTSIAVPSGKLSSATTYYWRVRYQDNRGDWSAWSAETSFATSGSAPVVVWYEQFTASNTGTYLYGQDWRYQTFTPSTSHTLNTVSLYLYKQGAPDYTVTIGIYSVGANHKPTGSPLCSTTFAASSLTTTAGWRTYTFSTGCPVSAGVEYAIVLSGNGGNSSNRVVVRVNTAGGYSGGVRGYSLNGGATWLLSSAQDMAFKEGQSSVGAPTWYEQLTSSNTGTYLYGQDWRYQTFTPSTSHTLNMVSLYLYKQGAPDYTVTIGIYAVGANHKPTGSPLCTTTFAASLLTTTANWYTFTFSSGCPVSAGVEYAIVLSGDGGNSSNRVVVRVNTAGGYSGGVRGYSLNGGTTWLLSSAQDMAFKEGQT
jgi:internalin A